jgi:CheY-like chemotaxis protein
MSFEFKVMELKPLLVQALASNEGFAGQHKVRLTLDASAGPARVNVDPDRLTQVVTNLLSNAVKYSPRDGTVEVRIRHAGSRVRVEIRDQGAGIPDEFRGRIFQKFSQADSSDARMKGGTGLGLSIAKAIVERLDGIIGFISKPGAGTTFYFELPEWHDKPAPAEGNLGPRPRILICEDDADIARLIGLMLDNAGFDSDIARDAGQARALLEHGRYAAMTVDISLPGEDGLSLVRTLREAPATRDLPVIVVSATADEDRVEIDNESLTVSDWLQKPIDENRLIIGIRNVTGDMCPSR